MTVRAAALCVAVLALAGCGSPDPTTAARQRAGYDLVCIEDKLVSISPYFRSCVRREWQCVTLPCDPLPGPLPRPRQF